VELRPTKPKLFFVQLQNFQPASLRVWAEQMWGLENIFICRKFTTHRQMKQHKHIVQIPVLDLRWPVPSEISDLRNRWLHDICAPEVAAVTFSESESAPVPKIFNPGLGKGPEFFKFENPTPVQTPATIDSTEIYPCFYLRNDHADSCHGWKWKVTPDSVFHKLLASVPKEKRRILPESTSARRIHGHFCCACAEWYSLFH